MRSTCTFLDWYIPFTHDYSIEYISDVETLIQNVLNWVEKDTLYDGR